MNHYQSPRVIGNCNRGFCFFHYDSGIHHVNNSAVVMFFYTAHLPSDDYSQAVLIISVVVTKPQLTELLSSDVVRRACGHPYTSSLRNSPEMNEKCAGQVLTPCSGADGQHRLDS